MPSFASNITFPGFQAPILPPAVSSVQAAFQQMGGFLAMDSAQQLISTVAPIPAFVTTPAQEFLFAGGGATKDDGKVIAPAVESDISIETMLEVIRERLDPKRLAQTCNIPEPYLPFFYRFVYHTIIER